jgi:hypothetical protein
MTCACQVLRKYVSIRTAISPLRRLCAIFAVPQQHHREDERDKPSVYGNLQAQAGVMNVVQHAMICG